MDPRDNGSLHSITRGPSAYQNAIRQIGNIVASYDADKNFPVWYVLFFSDKNI